MEIDVSILNILVGTIIPILVGIVAKKVAHAGLKASLNASLSVASAVLISGIENGGTLGTWQELAGAAVLTFVVSISAYYGFWKPTGTAEIVQDKTANFGLGA